MARSMRHRTDTRKRGQHTHMHARKGGRHTHMHVRKGGRHTHMHVRKGGRHTHMHVHKGGRHTHMHARTHMQHAHAADVVCVPVHGPRQLGERRMIWVLKLERLSARSLPQPRVLRGTQGQRQAVQVEGCMWCLNASLHAFPPTAADAACGARRDTARRDASRPACLGRVSAPQSLQSGAHNQWRHSRLTEAVDDGTGS
eukprot:16412-Chlamydomonas_euryale.AAC.3